MKLAEDVELEPLFEYRRVQPRNVISLDGLFLYTSTLVENFAVFESKRIKVEEEKKLLMNFEFSFTGRR